MSTSSVPRATIRPRERVEVLPSSSAGSISRQVIKRCKVEESGGGTSRNRTGTYLVASPEHRQAPGSSIDHDPSASLVLCAQSYKSAQFHLAETKNKDIEQGPPDSLSLPPLNLTMISLSMYLAKSSIFSFFGFSAPWACAPPPPPPLAAPPRPRSPPPRPPPPRPLKLPLSDMEARVLRLVVVWWVGGT